MGISSDADDARAGFEEAIRSFGLDSPSRGGKSVGDRALKTVADGILERANRSEGTDGRWQDNASSVIYRKGRNSPNVDTGAMLSREQIEGDQSVGRNEASMTYGKDDDCRKRAGFAHEGASALLIKRPFYGMSDSDIDKIVDGILDDLINHLSRG